MKKLYILLLFIFVVKTGYNQNLTGFQKIVDYPFSNNATDLTGNYSDATVLNAPYQNGGIYSNGKYSGNDTTGSYIRTPNITGLDLEKFAIKLDFKADTVGKDILICGYYWRWLTVYTNPDSTLELYANLNNSTGKVITTNFKVVPGTWYSLGMVFDSLFSHDLNIFIDNSFVGNGVFLTHFNHQNDFTFSNENGGTAVTFKGHWKNLQIYNQCTSAPVAGFSANTNGLTVNFTDTTSGVATSFIWDFGDGSVSTEQNPQYTYLAQGVYTVCLIASNSCDADTVCNTVIINSTGINNNEEIDDAFIYPNPNSGVFTISTKEIKNRTYGIYSVSGQMIEEGQLTEFKKEINISNVPQGLYFLRIRTDEYNVTHKLIIN